MSGAFPVVRGLKLRATKINSCGLPIAGPKNRIVTDGFVTFNIDPVMKDAEELTQQNAAGKDCVSDRTPPERRWYTITAELCGVNSGLITLLNGWPQVLDYDDNPIGFRDRSTVEGDYGVAFEIWTGGTGDDDCAVPTSDSIFSATTSGKQYGYFLIGGKEFTLGAIDIGAQVSTFTLAGISVAMSNWGRGPYNVAATDANGTPGRLLVPLDEDQHITVFRTPVPPPENSPGGDPVPLAILTKFTAPNYYFGGPANEPEADVAPDQDTTDKTITVTATGGTYTVIVDGTPTADIAFGATGSQIATAVNALAGIDGAVGTGSSSPYGLSIPGIHTVTLGTGSLTGGSATIA